MNLTYFAQDGSFGDAHNIEIIDTSDFNEDDWTNIWEAGDSNRTSVALEIVLNKINDKIEKEK
jgi:hypothetical protein